MAERHDHPLPDDAEHADGAEVVSDGHRPDDLGPGLRLAGALVALTAVVCVVVTAFSWPASRTQFRDVPLGVAGSTVPIDRIQQQLDEALPGAFEVRKLADEQAARRAIERREVYGAVVVPQQGSAAVLTASAASAVVAQGISQLLGSIGGQVQATDVVAAPRDDPRGAGFAAAVLPLAIAGIAGGALLTLLGRALPVPLRLAAAAGYAVLVGLAFDAVLQGGLGILDGPPLANAGVLALAVAATTFAVLGLATLLGRPGIAIGALLAVLVGNPLSGATSAPELLPRPWGAIGQGLPQGASATLLRRVAFFPEAPIATPLLVLLAWVVGGALLALVVTVLRRQNAAARAASA